MPNSELSPVYQESADPRMKKLQRALGLIPEAVRQFEKALNVWRRGTFNWVDKDLLSYVAARNHLLTHGVTPDEQEQLLGQAFPNAAGLRAQCDALKGPTKAAYTARASTILEFLPSIIQQSIDDGLRLRSVLRYSTTADTYWGTDPITWENQKGRVGDHQADEQ